MSKLAALAAARTAAKETAANMTEVTKGGGEARLLPAGPAIVQMISYVEFGNQPQSFNGKAKAPKPEVQLGFIIHGPQYANEDGTPYKIFPYPFTLDQNEKARAIAIFKCMNWQGTATHFSDFLGTAFIGKIVHEPKSKTDPKIVSRLDLKGFLPPLDAMSGQPYQVPAINEDDMQYFFFEQPTLETWNALYQEGTFDNGDSKNRLQETIAGATNYEGSALEAMLSANGIPRPIAKPRAAQAPAAALPGAPAQVAAALPNASTVAATPSVAAVMVQPASPMVSAPVVVGGTPVADPLALAGSAITPAIAAATPPVITSPIVIGAPVVPTTISPSNPALPRVG